MGFGPVRLTVVPDQIAPQPKVGLGLVLGRVEVIERFVRLLNRTKRTLDLAFRSSCHPPAVRSLRHVRADVDAQLGHDRPKHPAGDGALLQALQNPRVNIAGIRRADLLPGLGMFSPTRLSRQLRRLLDIGVIKRVAGTYRYYLT